MSTLHVKPLSGPGNLAADEPHKHSESCTTPLSNSKLALASSALCTKLHATQPLARDVSTLLEGEGGFNDACSGGSHTTLLYGFIFRSTFRASMFITVATKTNSITRHGTE